MDSRREAQQKREQLERLASRAKEQFGLNEVLTITTRQQAKEHGLHWPGHVVYFLFRTGAAQLAMPLNKAVAYESDEEDANLRLMAAVLVNAAEAYEKERTVSA